MWIVLTATTSGYRGEIGVNIYHEPSWSECESPWKVSRLPNGYSLYKKLAFIKGNMENF